MVLIISDRVIFYMDTDKHCIMYLRIEQESVCFIGLEPMRSSLAKGTSTGLFVRFGIKNMNE